MTESQNRNEGAPKTSGRFLSRSALAVMALSLVLVCGSFVMNRIMGNETAAKKAPAAVPSGASSDGSNADQIPQAMRDALAANESRKMPPVSDDAVKGMMGAGQMPSEIPQAMYDAMKRRGMEIPDTVTVVPDSTANVQSGSGTAPNDAAPSPDASPQADPATAAVLEMIKAAPHDVEILLKAASMLAKNGRADLAAEQLNHAMISAPDDARPSRELGRMLAEAGRYEEAAEKLAYSAEREQDPETLLMLVHICRHHLDKPDLAKAYALTLKALPVEDGELKKRIDEELAALQN